jgi:probable HAF family extracellular repeat protein
MKDLGNRGASPTVPLGINNATTAHPVQVVGGGVPSSGGGAWLWQNGVMTDLNTLLPANSGWVLSEADGINDSQQIVGQGIINGQNHAYVWQIQQVAGSPVGVGMPTDLGTLPGVANSGAKAINNTGQVAGWSNTPPPKEDDAVLWTSGQIKDLGTLPNDGWAHAYALNNSSQVQVVGTSAGGSLNPDGHAFLWQNGTIIDLNSQLPKKSGWSLLENAYGVNDTGQIVGDGWEGTVASASHHAFLLTPSSGHGNAPINSSLSAAVQIGSFTASPNPASAGSLVTLTAAGVTTSNAGSTVAQVAFYLDSNRDGILEPATDTLLGYGTQSNTGTWTLTFSTAGWAPGNYRLFARAEDSLGDFGDPLALTLQVL